MKGRKEGRIDPAQCEFVDLVVSWLIKARVASGVQSKACAGRGGAWKAVENLVKDQRCIAVL